MTDPHPQAAALDAAHVLVVEDDADLAHLIASTLQGEGFDVDVARDGAVGLERALGDLGPAPDVVVLDLMLPALDGLEVCRRVRAARPEVLVLMVTAKSGELDRVVGLEIGADDYVTKPFSLRELAARVKALLRRKAALQAHADAGGEPLEFGRLRIDPRARTVELDGRDVHLTTREFDLLEQFARAPGRVFRRAELLDRVWGAGFDGFDHTVNSHINRLRAKLEPDPGDPTFIRTVWGVGYRFDPPQS